MARLTIELADDDPKLPAVLAALGLAPAPAGDSSEALLTEAIRSGTDLHQRFLGVLAAASPRRLAATEVAEHLGMPVESFGGSIGALNRRLPGLLPGGRRPWDAGVPGTYALSETDALTVRAALAERGVAQPT